MIKRLNVENNSSLKRDSKSHAIINVDQESYQKRMMQQRKNNEIGELREEISSLKKDFDDIKGLLNKLLEK